jgi:hypothetical protein
MVAESVPTTPRADAELSLYLSKKNLFAYVGSSQQRDGIGVRNGGTGAYL